MKTEQNIRIAFILNLAFSVFEFVGGLLTGSVAILSDAIHDIGDAASIGVSYFFEKLSKRKPDSKYTYGYTRFSVLGSAVTTVVLLLGSLVVLCNAVQRIITPTPIHYNGMILFAVVGLCVNGVAAFVTREGDSLNQKAVNLHMLEDVLGWVVVLLGAIVMRFTNLWILDPVMSMGIAIFILVNASKNMLQIVDLFLDKTPESLDIQELKEHICHIDGVIDVHHIHLWSLDGQRNYATMHIVTNADGATVKKAVRRELLERGVGHATLELEAEGETCHARKCEVQHICLCGHHHH